MGLFSSVGKYFKASTGHGTLWGSKGTTGQESPADPYAWMQGDPGQKNWKMGYGMGTEYWKLKGQLLYDPTLNQMEETALGTRGLGRTLAQSQASQAGNAVSQALAARGGGNIASALTMGSQARVGSGLEGMQAGLGMELGALGNYLQAKWGALTALFAKQAGFSAAQLAADASKYGADKGVEAAAWGTLGSALKGLGGGGNDGGG